MTGEEIIEALDLCTQQNGSIPCYNCPCWNSDEQKCEGIDYTATLDLINRQKTEIERLKECPKCVYEYDGEITEYCVQGPCSNFKTVEQVKDEAYKEFAERLKEKISDCHIVSDGEYCGFDCGDIYECIDNILKEMVGDDNA